MAVVIGEVEVVPTDNRGSSGDAAPTPDTLGANTVDDIALQRALQALQEQALRNWSH
jgi:hypothetical protein